MFRFIQTSAAIAALGIVSTVSAQVTAPPGYIYDAQLLSSLTQGCVAPGPGGTFVGIGPGFTANGQSIVLAKESGELRLVALGFNSIADCAYDAAADVLYVTDNADNGDFVDPNDFLDPNSAPTVALTGDTVFAIADASTASGVPAVGLEVLPSGSLEFAASVVVESTGDILVGSAAGFGNGDIVRIDDTPTSTTFASGFDFTGGIAVNLTSGDVFVAESLASFANQISQFDSTGGTIAAPLAGPSFGFGSGDLVLLPDGNLLATGLFFGDVVTIDPDDPNTVSPFVSGLTFAGGSSVNAFTGRIELLSSTFTGADEDKSIHRFVPTDRLVPGSGSDKTECLHEFYGVELVAPAPGRPARKAICRDGAACDADGTANDQCVFPVGSCLNVFDLDFPECATDAAIAEFTISVRPASLAINAVGAEIASALPVDESACFFSDGVTVPVRITGSGAKKSGKAKVAISSRNAAGARDKDSVSLVCEPAAL